MKVLVVEDDKKIADYLTVGLNEAGYTVDMAADGSQGLNMVLNTHPDIILMDIMLPNIDGFTHIKSIRENQVQNPILIISAKETVDDRVNGLLLGVDDFLTKPFSFTELVARIQAILRRGNYPKNSFELKFEDIYMNILKREVTRGNKKLELHIKEFQLLEYLMMNPERVLTKTQILEKIWGYNFDPQSNTVDVLVCRLRNKVDKDFNLKSIHTIRGIGYF